MNNTDSPTVDTFGRSLMISDSQFNSVAFRRRILSGNETRYEMYTGTELLLADNSILCTHLQALRRCPIIASLLYRIEGHFRATIQRGGIIIRMRASKITAVSDSSWLKAQCSVALRTLYIAAPAKSLA